MSPYAKAALIMASLLCIGLIVWLFVLDLADEESADTARQGSPDVSRGELDSQTSGPRGKRDVEPDITSVPFTEKPAKEPVEKLPPYGSLVVKIVWKKTAEAATDVPVRFLPWGGQDPFFNERVLRTDAHGSLEIERIHVGTVGIYCLLGGATRAKVEAGKQTQATIEIPPGVAVSGRVVDAHDRGVQGARVWVSNEGLAGSIDVTSSDADGAFAIPALKSDSLRWIGARAKGFAPSTAEMIIGPLGGSVKVTLVLPGSGASVRGRVEGPDGQPVAGAKVRVGKRSHDQFTLPNGSQGTHAPPAHTVTDADGLFIVDGLPAGETPMVVRARDLGAWLGSTELEENTVKELRISLVEPAVVTGKVSDEEGKPIERASIQINGYGRFLSSFTRTVANGTFTLRGVSPGAIEIKAEKDGRGEVEATLQAAPGETVHWNAVLEGGPEISGKVIDEAGKPLEGWNVSLQSMAMKKWDHKFAKTDAEGRFVAKHCIDQPYTVSVTLPGGGIYDVARQEKVKPGGPPVVLRVPESALHPSAIIGRVQGFTGHPVSGARVSAWRVGYRGGSPIKITDESGRFEFKPVPPGSYRISVRAPGLASYRGLELEAPPDGIRDAGVIVLPAPGTVLVSIHAGAGKIPDDLNVIATRLDGEGREWLRVEGATARSGPMWPGRWSLKVAGEGIATQQFVRDIKTDHETRLDVTLAPGVARQLRFLDPPGARATAKVNVVIRNESGAIVFERSYRRYEDRPLEATVTLEPGTLTIEAASESGRNAIATVVFDVTQGTMEPVDLLLR